jgi:ankyrin repeat protein
LNTLDRRGQTALHLAAASGHEDAVRMLIEKGANPTVKDRSGRTPADLARVFGKAGMLALLYSLRVP